MLLLIVLPTPYSQAKDIKMIKFTNVSKTYGDNTHALRNLTLEIKDGEFVFIVGPNGAGKTTLTKLMLHEELPTSGKIEVNGYDVVNIKKRHIPHLRRTVGVVFQDFRLFEKMTVFDNIAFAMHVVGTPKRVIKKKVHTLLKLVELEGKGGSYPYMLSGGEQRRVALARALANNPDTIIADEPTSNSDKNSSEHLMRLLAKVQEHNKTVIVITHDLSAVKRLDKRVITLADGAVISDIPGGDNDEEN